MIAKIFFTAVVLAATCSAREYNCTQSETECIANGMQKMRVSGLYVCCPLTAELSINNSDCKCVEPDAPNAGQPEQCLQNVPMCARHGTSFNRDSKQQMRCCLSGYILETVQNTDECTCTPLADNSGVPGPILPGLVGQPVGPNAPPADFREQWRRIGQDWKNFGQELVGGVGTWARNFGHGVRQTGRNLAGDLSGIFQSALRSSVSPIRRALDGFVSNTLRG